MSLGRLPPWLCSHIVDDAIVVGAGIAQGANILQKVEVVRQCFALETLAAEFREVVKAAKGNDFLKGPDGETKIRKGCDKISGIRAIFATLDFLLQSIGRFAAVWVIVTCQEILDDLVSVLVALFNMREQHDLGEMLDIQRQSQHLITKEHIDDGKVDEHLEVKIRKLPFALALFDSGKSLAIGSQAEEVVVLG